MGHLFNQPQHEAKRRVLRRQSPPAEVILWQHLRNRQLGGYKFRRQFGIARYVADFCCVECQVIVELDGPSHDGDDAVEYDVNRTHYFESLDFTVVRLPISRFIMACQMC